LVPSAARARLGGPAAWRRGLRYARCRGCERALARRIQVFPRRL